MIVVLNTCICFQCNAQKNLTDSKKSNSFLKWVLENEKATDVSTTPLKIDFGVLNILSKEITFSKKDSIDIQKQIVKNEKSNLNSSISLSKHFLNDGELKESMKNEPYWFLKVSKPIFFQDKVLIIVEEHCGIECGSGEIQVYQIKNSTYNLLFKEMIWIS